MTKRAMFKNVFYIVALVLLILFANLNFIIGIFFSAPLSYNGVPFVVENAVIGPHDPIKISLTRCVDSKTPIVVTTVRSLVNIDTGDGEQYPPNTGIANPGCIAFTPSLPPIDAINNTLPAGRYKFTAIATVVTDIRTYHVPWETTVFYYDPDKEESNE